MRHLTTVLTIFFAFIFTGSQLLARGPVQVTVSILPQKYFVEKIGGKFVNIAVMCPPGAFPGMYEPKPKQMVALTKSKIFFAIGVPYERTWLEKFTKANPSLYICHTEQGIEKRIMKTSRRLAHVNKIRSMDPHVWLSPPLVMIQARNIHNAFVRSDPENKVMYDVRYRHFIDELVDIDLKIRDIFMDKGSRHMFMVFHPSWGYFADTYDLKQVPIEIEGKEPKASDLKHLIIYAKSHGIDEIFLQPQQSRIAARSIAEAIGARLVTLDPLSPRWASNIIDAALKIRAALR